MRGANPFELGHTTKGCTRGVWTMFVDRGDHVLCVMDTEGLGDALKPGGVGAIGWTSSGTKLYRPRFSRLPPTHACQTVRVHRFVLTVSQLPMRMEECTVCSCAHRDQASTASWWPWWSTSAASWL